MNKSKILLVDRGGKTDPIFVQEIPEHIYLETVKFFLIAHGREDFDIPINEIQLNRFSIRKGTKLLRNLIKCFVAKGYPQEILSI